MQESDGFSLTKAIATLVERFPKAVSPSVEEPLFVLAAGEESGTDTLRRLLAGEWLLWSDHCFGASLVRAASEPLRRFVERGTPNFEREDTELTTFGERLLAAQHASFEALFAAPARCRGRKRWGVVATDLTIEHAVYLKWLFPKGKFLFLVRHPFDAYRASVEEPSAGGVPRPSGLAANAFGRRWAEVSAGFLDGRERVGGLVVRYEEVASQQFTTIDAYLGIRLNLESDSAAPNEQGAGSDNDPISAVELWNTVGEVAERLGYGFPSTLTAGNDRAASQSVSFHPSHCVVLVPVGNRIEPECERGLRELERRGYEVRRIHGYSQIDVARCAMATKALADGFDETMWIDADIEFDPDDVEKLRFHRLPMVSGVYPKKGKRELASHVLPGTAGVVFGEEGGLYPFRYAATGFLHVRRLVYDDIRRELQLPLCDVRFGEGMIPFFQPLVVDGDRDPWYLAEDFAFSERAGRCGHRIWVDTTIRLNHIGSYGFSWEEAGSAIPRRPTYAYWFTDTASNAKATSGIDRPNKSPSDRDLLYTFVGGKISLNALESPRMRARVLGAYEPDCTRALVQRLRPGMTFIDVGAGRGYFALLASRLVGPNGRVVAFEPHPVRFGHLQNGIHASGYAHASAVPLAIGGNECQAVLHIAAGSSDWSLTAPNPHLCERCLPVAMCTLDAALREHGVDRVDMLRMHAPGVELALLDGAPATLAHAGTFLLQFSACFPPDRAALWLRLVSLGFAFFDPQAPSVRLARIPAELRTVLGVRL